MQDIKSMKVIAIAGLKKNLYVLDTKSFDPFIIKEVLQQYASSLYIENDAYVCNVTQPVSEKASFY